LAEHEQSHRSATFQPLTQKPLESCKNSNEEIAYDILGSGNVYSQEEAKAAKEARARTPPEASDAAR
jgi:hypothetical protein